jgi:hypothetical protein
VALGGERKATLCDQSLAGVVGSTRRADTH